MVTRDDITGTASRRGLLHRAGDAVTTVAAPDNPDAVLLAQAAQFWREHWQYTALKRRSTRLRTRAARGHDCAARATPAQDPKLRAAWKAWHDAFQQVKQRAAGIFALPARTPAGVLAKLRIVATAYGVDAPENADDGDAGDEDLYAASKGWLASTVHDLEAIVDLRGTKT